MRYERRERPQHKAGYHPPQDIWFDPEAFDLLPAEVQQELLDWIHQHFTSGKRGGSRIFNRTTYAFKARFLFDTGIYLSDGAMKGAMLRAGYEPINRSAQSWEFRARFNWTDRIAL